MIQTLQIAFWIALFLVFYTYVGYAILVWFLVKIKSIIKPWQEPEIPANEDLPTCTLAVPGYNEVDFIRAKAENALALKYPKDKLKIVFVTDGSNDGTPDVLREIDGIEVWHRDERKGKIAAMNRAMEMIDSEITVFCDANTMLNETCLLEIAKHYQDPKVGGVSGEKVVLSDDEDNASGAGEGIYWKYESFLKRKDAELHTLVGSAGELFSVRTELFKPVEADSILDDFMISMRLVEQGYKVAYEPKARASETASVNVAEEFKRKVRIAAGGFQSIARLKSLLNFFKYGWASFEYVSHRVMRWAVAPFMLPLILLLNVVTVMLDQNLLFHVLLVLQFGFYGAAILGWVLEQRKIKLKILFVPFYFSMMNYAVLAGFKRHLKGSQSALWEKSKRKM
jgi:cellulose synthase/poly-beta-1,6-N-acetylglucosamine synthase-like glycosyltransferase